MSSTHPHLSFLNQACLEGLAIEDPVGTDVKPLAKKCRMDGVSTHAMPKQSKSAQLAGDEEFKELVSHNFTIYVQAYKTVISDKKLE